MSKEHKTMTFLAENINTGEVIQGNVKEVAACVGCAGQTIRYYGRMQGKLYRGTWKIELLPDKINVTDEYNSLTEEDLQKWDDFIESIHKKKPNKKGRFRKPQEVR